MKRKYILSVYLGSIAGILIIFETNNILGEKEPADCEINVFTSKAPIVIDGNLDEWNSFKLEKKSISNPVVSQWRTVPKNLKEDVSGEFRFVADSTYLYIAVSVRDDSVITEMEKPIKGYENDSVVFIFGETISEKIKKRIYEIRVAMSKGGSVQVFGYPGSLETDVPYFWDAYGVKANVKKMSGGYNVEVAIPYILLQWLKSPKRNVFQFNVYINDNDNDNEYGMTNHRLSWAEGKDGRGISRGQELNIVRQGRKLNVPYGKVQGDDIIDKRYNQLGLKGIRLDDQCLLMENLLMCFEKGDWKNVLNVIKLQKNKVWTKPLQIIANIQTYDFQKGFALIDETMKYSNDEYVKQWVIEYLFITAEEWLKNKINYNYAAYLLIKYIRYNIGKYEEQAYEDIRFSIHQMGFYNYSRKVDGQDILIELEMLTSQDSKSFNNNESLKLSVAEAYFYYNDFNKAEDMATSLLCNTKIDKIRVRSETLIMSINQIREEKK